MIGRQRTGARPGLRPRARTRARGWAGPLAALVALAIVPCCGNPPSPYRHVLWISLDTTRADRLGCYGGPAHTPRLDALASRGLRCAAAVAPAPTTLASHTAQMTGLYPNRHGVPRNGFIIDEENVMLAELFAEAGFHTAAFLGSFALDRPFRFDQGFAHFDAEFDLRIGEQKVEQDQRRADAVTDAVLHHLDEIGQADRLFLFVHYFDAHAPYDPPPAFRPEGATLQADYDAIDAAIAEHQRAAGITERTLGWLFLNGLTPRMSRELGGEPLGRDRELAALYDGEIAFIDSQIGRLLDGLEARGILDETLIVVTADHGETFWEHEDLWNHGLSVYDTTVHVPCLLVLPDGRGAGRVLETPVSTIDIFPTLCELFALDAPAQLEGRSLVPALDGGSLQARWVFSEATQPIHPALENPRTAGAWPNRKKRRAARRGPFKLVSDPLQGWTRLFRIDRDPFEQDDLLDTARHPRLGPQAAAALREGTRALREWSEHDPLRPVRFNPSQQAEVRRRLKNLGYAGEGEPVARPGEDEPGPGGDGRDGER